MYGHDSLTHIPAAVTERMRVTGSVFVRHTSRPVVYTRKTGQQRGENRPGLWAASSGAGVDWCGAVCHKLSETGAHEVDDKSIKHRPVGHHMSLYFYFTCTVYFSNLI